MKRRLLFQTLGAVFAVSFGMVSVAHADPFAVTPTNVALTLANALVSGGSGITINSATYVGAATAAGTFTGGTGIISFDGGIVLTSGAATFVAGPNNSSGAGINNGAPGTALIPGLTTLNATVLSVNFTPTGNTVQFSYVFGSEEYNEFVNSSFNDAFRFFVNGTNFALIPGTSTPVQINNVNNGQSGAGPCTNCAFYVDNTGGGLNTQLDGLTTTLAFVAPVNPNVSNTLQLVIADVSDPILDSAVFIAAGSFAVCGEPGQPPCGNGPVIPEPGTIVLLGTGLVGIATAGWRRSRKQR